MEKGLSETNKERIKKIALIIAIVLFLLIILLFFLLFKKTYQVSFDSNGGSEVASIKVKDGDKIEEPEDPIREGYVFAGWYYLDELFDFDLPVKKNMTLRAEWEDMGNAEVEGITLSTTDLALAPEGTAVLVATLQPENAKQVKLIWTSSDETIATVDENGNVKALKEGTVIITVTTEDEKYSASCTVTISKETVVETNTQNNNNNNLNTSSKPSDQNTSNNQNTPSNPNIPSDPNIPNNPNTPSDPNIPNTPNIPTTPDNPSEPSVIEPSGVSISGINNMTVGDTGKLTATITPNNANSKTKLTWSSSNAGVVTVDQNGNITAVGEGSATITVTTENGKSASITITVKAKESTYVIYLTARKIAVTEEITQYNFRVTKDGKDFTGYISFTYNGSTTFKEDGSVSSTVVNKNITTAVINFSDRTTRNATVVIN